MSVSAWEVNEQSATMLMPPSKATAVVATPTATVAAPTVKPHHGNLSSLESSPDHAALKVTLLQCFAGWLAELC